MHDDKRRAATGCDEWAILTKIQQIHGDDAYRQALEATKQGMALWCTEYGWGAKKPIMTSGWQA